MISKILLLLIPLFVQTVYGQTLKDIFIELPLGGLAVGDKKQMIYDFQNHKDGNEKQRPYLIDYRPGNQYLSFSGDYEGSESLKYWDVSNGSQLIGIGYLECSGLCNYDLRFYLKKGEKTNKLEANYVLPEVTIADFFDTEQMKKAGISKLKNSDFPEFYGFLYHLPQEGENITVESQTHRFGKIPDEYKKYDLGSKIELIWNDGTFKKRDQASVKKENAEAQKAIKIFTIDDCITEFSMSDTTQIEAGYQFLFAESKFNEGRTLQLNVVAPGLAIHPPDKHIEDEFIYVLEGTAEFYLDGKTKVVGPNTSFYCPPNIEHGIKNIGDTELKYLLIKKYDQ